MSVPVGRAVAPRESSRFGSAQAVMQSRWNKTKILIHPAVLGASATALVLALDFGKDGFELFIRSDGVTD